MNLENDVRNQHFVSQAEQRLNALNPAAEKENQRIYSFEIANRETYELRLLCSRGNSISCSLRFLDLFSFDVGPDKQIRKNFETLFKRYEDNVGTYTETLLCKLSSGQQNVDVSDEVVNLFVAKFLNFARNPFSIRKMLNTFRAFTNYVPALPKHQEYFERILNGRKPHQAHLCQEFGIDDSEYEQWLGILFMLLIPPDDGGLNLLESIVKSSFVEHEVRVLVSRYSAPRCLLSDRSFSTNVDEPGCDGFDFNLSSRAFIRYLFADIGAVAGHDIPPKYIERYKSERKKLPLKISPYPHLDDMELLRGFNRNVVYQSHQHVYCASDKPFV